MSIRHLDALLAPNSVAVFGASARPASVGATVWRNLLAGGFTGVLMPVNPKHAQLDDHRCFASVDELAQTPDLAIICTPPATVTRLIRELAERGTRAAIVLTAGLGAVVTQDVLDAARPQVLRVLGPNCLGLMTPRLGLNASFAHTGALPGELAFVSQSGALVTAMLDWAKSRHIGFSHLVSLGESADVDFGDLLDHLASDAATRSILLYIESIKSPRKFMSAARAAARNKPVVVVKAGRAGHGIQAAASHTGALAGNDLVFDAAIRRAGMLRVDTLQELFIAAQTLARFGANRSEVMTIMTNGGGGGVMAADAADRLGVPLWEPDAELLARLDAVLPPTWSHGNPIDLIGDAPAERYAATLEALLAEPRSGAILFIHAPTAIVPSPEIAERCLPLVQPAAQRVMSCWLGDDAVVEARRRFSEAGIADYATPEEAVGAFSMLLSYRRNQAQLLEVPAGTAQSTPDAAAARHVIDQALAEGQTWLAAPQVDAVLRAYGIPLPQSLAVAPTEDAAADAARQIGGPVALKIVSPDILHKSDIGGVQLDLADEAAVRVAARTMLARVRKERPEARVEGFWLQEMVDRPRAHELIIGASVDGVFGPVLLFGQGGVSVEVVGDRAIALPPLNEALARELVGRTRVSKLLAGYRDRPAARVDSVIDVLLAVGAMLSDLPELAELDINPLLADEHGVLALDARIRLSAERPAGADHFAIRPYPQALVEAIDWRGTPLTLRPIRPEDADQHEAFLRALTPEDIRMRIFQTRRELPRSELARLTQIDYAREMAFIAERGSTTRETLGTARLSCNADGTEAEFAVIVRSDLKGQGLGRQLMDKLIRYARAQGIERLVGMVLRENQAMLDLATHCGFQIDDAQDLEKDVVYLVLPLSPLASTSTSPPPPGQDQPPSA